MLQITLRVSPSGEVAVNDSSLGLAPFAPAAAAGTIAVSTTTAAAVFFTMALAAAATATVAMFFFRLRLQLGDDQFAVFKQRNCLRGDLRIGSINHDALRHQHAQRDAMDRAAEYDVHADTVIWLAFFRLQGNVLLLPGFGIKEQKSVGFVQIRLNDRFDAFIL